MILRKTPNTNADAAIIIQAELLSEMNRLKAEKGMVKKDIIVKMRLMRSNGVRINRLALAR